MANKDTRAMLGEAFLSIAKAVETGTYGKKPRIGLGTLGSEHGMENMLEGAKLAAQNGDCDIVLIGPKCDAPFEQAIAENESQAHKKMEEMLDNGSLDAAVSMHYSFPIGVATVGRFVSPARGREVFLASTTGTSSTKRSQAMVLNAVGGIIAAKACGIKNPSLGILNVDNARTVERALMDLSANGYTINFGGSKRSDGGAIMRGNDLLTGSADVMVTDSLSGNIFMKLLSSFTSGGSYETTGCGYGPGIGPDYRRCILILSRASGSPVVAGAIRYALALAKGNIQQLASEEYGAAKAAGLDRILASLDKNRDQPGQSVIPVPAKEVLTGTIAGIDIMELDRAVERLWANNIYAESGMGCTGPIVMVNDAKISDAVDILIKEGFVSKETARCQ